jgi:hypothetical protein
MRKKKGVFEVFEVILIEVELPPEDTIRNPATPLQHGDCLVKDLLKGHSPPSLAL